MDNRKVFFKGAMSGAACVILLLVIMQILSGVALVTGQRDMTVNEKVAAIYNLLDNNYIDNYDKNELTEEMYYRLVYGLGDKYTTYMDKYTLAAFMEQTEGVYAGIGVAIELGDTGAENDIVVAVVFEGQPAHKAGMEAGDIIIKVNDTDVDGSMYNIITDMIKGPVGTSVKVTVYRPGEDITLEMNIVREEVITPSVFSEIMEDDIGYIRISSFERNTYKQFSAAYNELLDNKIKGLVIDLRNNPGGFLDVVEDIADVLVPEGYIVYTEDKNGNREYTHSDENKIEIPLAILVNENSASASEVLSGAVQDHGVGVLVGTQTFGKGLVQNLFYLPDKSGMKITIAKYYTPNGICIHGIGLKPDYVVELPEVKASQLSRLSLEEDTQLMKALEVVREAVN